MLATGPAAAPQGVVSSSTGSATGEGAGRRGADGREAALTDGRGPVEEEDDDRLEARAPWRPNAQPKCAATKATPHTIRPTPMRSVPIKAAAIKATAAPAVVAMPTLRFKRGKTMAT